MIKLIPTYHTLHDAIMDSAHESIIDCVNYSTWMFINDFNFCPIMDSINYNLCSTIQSVVRDYINPND